MYGEILVLSQNVTINLNSVLGLTAETFNIFFTTIVEKHRYSFHVSTVLPKLQTPRVENDFPIQVISLDFVRQQLTKLTIRTAAAFKDFPAKILKEAGHTVSKSITYLLNLTISSGEIP